MKPVLLYVFDPLCGWCYGFSPVISEFALRHKENFTFVVRVGGLVTGNRVGTFAQTYPQITESVNRVEELTGVQFGSGFRQEVLADLNRLVLNSEPSCTAFRLMRAYDPTRAVEMSSRIQNALYSEGLDIMQPEVLADLAVEFGMGRATFLQEMQSPVQQEATRNEFAEVHQMGIAGYPAVAVIQAQQGILCARGFCTLQQLEQQVAGAVGSLMSKV